MIFLGCIFFSQIWQKSQNVSIRGMSTVIKLIKFPTNRNSIFFENFEIFFLQNIFFLKNYYVVVVKKHARFSLVERKNRCSTFDKENAHKYWSRALGPVNFFWAEKNNEKSAQKQVLFSIFFFFKGVGSFTKRKNDPWQIMTS